MTPPSAATLRAPAVAPRPGRRGGLARPARSPVPRRVSGPARRAATVERLPDRLIDRLIGGRAWIAVIAFALIGIVAMQLWVVKLGVGIGRALEHTQLLQRENATLAGEDSALSSAERIERLALAQGMVLASPGALHFDQARGPLDVRLAAGALAKPLAQTPTTPATTTPVAGGRETATAGEATPTTETQPASTAQTTAESTSETQATPTATSQPTAPAASPPASTEAAPPTAVSSASTEATTPSTGSGGGTQAPGG